MKERKRKKSKERMIVKMEKGREEKRKEASK